METIEVNFQRKKVRTIKITIPKRDAPPITFELSNELSKADLLPREMRDFFEGVWGRTRSIKR